MIQLKLLRHQEMMVCRKLLWRDHWKRIRKRI